jgi:hypothetical protein
MHLVHIEGENQLADAMTKMDVSIDYIGRLVHDRNDFFEGRATPIRDEHQKVRYQKTSLITKPVMYFRYLHPDYKTVPLLIDMEWLAEHGCELGTLFHYGSEVVRQFIPDAHSAHPAVAAHQTSLIYRLVNNDKPEQIITIPIHLDKHLFRQHGIDEITILSTIAEQINDYKYLFENCISTAKPDPMDCERLPWVGVLCLWGEKKTFSASPFLDRIYNLKKLCKILASNSQPLLRYSTLTF